MQNSNKICTLTISSQDRNTKIVTHAIILPQLTQFLPPFKITYLDLRENVALPLADPKCLAPAKIDMVIWHGFLAKLLIPGLNNNVGGKVL